MGEFELIADIVADLYQGDGVMLGPGDDAAVLRISGDLVVTTDLLIEEVHFKRSWSPPFEIGRKAVAVNVSDVEAMGAKPLAIVIGLAFPKDTGPEWLDQFQAGVRDECQRAGVSLVGGDLSSAGVVSICVTAHGQVVPGQATTRAGANVGDQVAVCGRLGWAAAGLTALQRGFRSPRELVAEQLCPTVPYGQGIVAAQHGATAMIDVSDGLIADLGHICELSGVGIDLAAESFTIPESIERVSAATGRAGLSFVLTGGEDHALAATFPSAATLPADWIRVGEVVSGDKVTLDRRTWDASGGWDHFAS